MRQKRRRRELEIVVLRFPIFSQKCLRKLFRYILREIIFELLLQSYTKARSRAVL